jgi:hypothetical protein
MKALQIIGIIWGAIYFVFGVASSFSLNGVDAAASIGLLLLTFLLPLPITLSARRFPKTSGVLLILCALASGAILLADHGIADTVTAFRTGFYIPHLILGVAYILTGRKEGHGVRAHFQP